MTTAVSYRLINTLYTCPLYSQQRDTLPDDQVRVSTPGGAIETGADYLVIGRPIRDADSPLAAAEAVLTEIGKAL